MHHREIDTFASLIRFPVKCLLKKKMEKSSLKLLSQSALHIMFCSAQ